MKSTSLTILILLVTGIILPGSTIVAVQDPESAPAKFKGIVVDKNIARVPNASVLVESANRKWKLVSDMEGENIGEINIELPPGKYKFTVDAPGFKRLVVTDFCIASGATITREFRLEVRDCDDCIPIPVKPARKEVLKIASVNHPLPQVLT